MENLMEIEQKIRARKQELSLIHNTHSVYSLKESHKFASKFPGKQAIKRDEYEFIFQRKTSCSGVIIPFPKTENFEYFVCVSHKVNMLKERAICVIWILVE